MVDLEFDTFDEPARAHVLEDAPSVLCCHWGSDAWNKVTPASGPVEGSHI